MNSVAKQRSDEKLQIAMTMLVISFVLLVHNGREPLFLIALSAIPPLLFVVWQKRLLWPIAIYLLIVGALGRYARYFRQGYMSDVIPAIQDYIGYFMSYGNDCRVVCSTRVFPLWKA